MKKYILTLILVLCSVSMALAEPSLADKFAAQHKSAGSDWFADMVIIPIPDDMKLMSKTADNGVSRLLLTHEDGCMAEYAVFDARQGNPLPVAGYDKFPVAAILESYKTEDCDDLTDLPIMMKGYYANQRTE